MKTPHRVKFPPSLLLIGIFAISISSCSAVQKKARWDSSSLGTASAACKSTVVPQVAEYDPASGQIHPLLVFDENLKIHAWQNNLPSKWLAESMDQLQIVACLGKIDRAVVETCHYTNGMSIDRVEYSASIGLVNAHTGKLISSYELKGGRSSLCPQVASVDSSPTIEGDKPTAKDLENWIEPFADGTMCTFEYQGKSLYMYEVPQPDGSVRLLALVEMQRTHSTFVDPLNPAAGPFDWQGNHGLLKRVCGQ